jgi:transposase InsO family protein
MMLEAVERRFGVLQSPAPLEWRTDNGSAYTAKETRGFATALNLITCFTPVQSPESNGISVSFVKRDNATMFASILAGCGNRARQARRMVRGLRREPPSSRALNALPPGVRPGANSIADCPVK